MRRALAVLPVAIVVAAGTAQAQPSPHRQTTAELSALVRAGAPGAVVAIRTARCRRTVRAKSFGPTPMLFANARRR